MATRKKSSKKKPARITLAELVAATKRKPYVPTSVGLKQGDRGGQVKRLQAYLSKFGYLESRERHRFGNLSAQPAAPPPKESVFDQNTARALRVFQQRNHLPVTGRLDSATMALMQLPRCDLPDLAPFIAQGNKWSTTALTYGFQNFSSDLSPAQIRSAISQAFGMWSAVTPLTFTEVALTENPDMVIGFVAGDHADGSPFDGLGGVLAHAFYPPPNGGSLAGDLHFDETEVWTVDLPPAGTDLVTVALHEIGHALGLAHSAAPGAVMAPFYSGPHRNLENDDVAGIQALYSSRVDWESLGGVITSNIAVGPNADGRLEIFARGTDNGPWHKSQAAPGNGWLDWASLGGVITGDPVVGQNADGRLELFACGTDNAVWHKWQVSAGGTWSAWTSLNGVITSKIAVGQNADGRLEIFARGTDNGLWHKWQTTAGNDWSSWASLGGLITRDPVVGRNADGRLQVLACGGDNAVWQRSQLTPGGAWSEWASLGGTATSNIAVARNLDGRLEIFIRGADNALYHKWQFAPGNGWSGWVSLGGVITSDPVVDQNADGRLEVFARGTDNAVWHQRQVTPGGGSSGWVSLSGVITGQISVARHADGRLDVFVRGMDNAVWHRCQAAPNDGWG
ncbi:MAG: matrixin family metalloprotease [Verrucomicrobiales bacterium]|nr:matrixin family metalloprotease [Verrucomicrobiales bacterium]